MKLKTCVIFLFIILMASCIVQREVLYIHEPDFSIYESMNVFDAGNIIETKNGAGSSRMPAWLAAYIAGGIEEVEKLDSYNGKYVFIAVNESGVFNILEKWTENFTVLYDFSLLAASRIEKRMILSSSLYPDDEYGMFFETFVKNAYNAEYPGVVKEDASWVRTIKYDYAEPRTVYMFFILISIDKTVMQNIVRNIMTRTAASVTMTNAQRNSINRLRQNIFEGF